MSEPIRPDYAPGFLLSKAALTLIFLAGVSAGASAAQGLTAVEPGQVKLGGEIGRRVDVTIKNNLLALNVDKDFLQPFRDKKATDGYVGLGKLIDATVRFAAYSDNEKVRALKNHLVEETIATQLKDGYIGSFRPERRIRVYWDLHEMVYIIHGLVSDYRLFGNRESLEAARRLGDYVMKNRRCTDPPRSVGKLNTERAFLALADATGQTKYLDYCVDGMNLRNWNAPVAGHAYTFMNLCIAQLDLYRHEPKDSLLAQSRRVIETLAARNALVITGTCSMGEAFHNSQDGRGNLGESCATAYLIRLMDNLLRIEGDTRHGDVMERAIYNALFAAQSPDGRRLRYFTCFEGKRVYYDRDTYCCPNNFRRIVAELPGMAYYRTDDGGLAVNLYIQSAARVKLRNDLSLAVRQETDYPNSGKVMIHVDPSRPARFPLRLRIPRWCPKASATLNGKRIVGEGAGGTFYALDRQWKPGDRIELEMPMPWRLVRGRKTQQGRVAVMRGPLLFCLNPQRQHRSPAPQQPAADALTKLAKRLREVRNALGRLDGAAVDLADVVGGGSGFGTGRPQQGIDTSTGKATRQIGTFLKYPANRFTAAESPFVDGVAIPDGGPDGNTPVPVSSTGLTLTGLPDTTGKTWDHAKYGRAHYQASKSVGKVDYTVEGHSMLSLHANKLITFDLEAIRRATGYSGLRFRAVVGYGGGPPPTAEFAVYLDGKPAVKRTAVTRAGLPLDIFAGPKSRLLTLVATDGGNEINHDQVFFGDPRLWPEPPLPAAQDDKTRELRRRLNAERNALARRQVCLLPLSAIVPGLRLDPKSIEGPLPDDTVRPDGTACRVRAWTPGLPCTEPTDLELVLTEFADPGGEAVYFLVPDLTAAVQDELIRTEPRK